MCHVHVQGASYPKSQGVCKKLRESRVRPHVTLDGTMKCVWGRILPHNKMSWWLEGFVGDCCVSVAHGSDLIRIYKLQVMEFDKDKGQKSREGRLG